MFPLMQIRNLNMAFGGLQAIKDFDLSIDEGELWGLIGPNGAGKTTLFNLISGIYKPDRGHIHYKGENIAGLKTDKIAAKGIVRTFQQTLLFSNLTVFQNVLVSTHLQCEIAFWSSLFSTSVYKKRKKGALSQASELLDFVGLNHVKHELTSNLPHGYQRSLGVAMALAAKPRLLLLDEPMTGMNHEETQSMMDLIQKINQFGITILVVEHNMKAIMGICKRVVVLNFGKKIAEGYPEEISKDETVIEAYLGS